MIHGQTKRLAKYKPVVICKAPSDLTVKLNSFGITENPDPPANLGPKSTNGWLSGLMRKMKGFWKIRCHSGPMTIRPPKATQIKSNSATRPLIKLIPNYSDFLPEFKECLPQPTNRFTIVTRSSSTDKELKDFGILELLIKSSASSTNSPLELESTTFQASLVPSSILARPSGTNLDKNPTSYRSSEMTKSTGFSSSAVISIQRDYKNFDIFTAAELPQDEATPFDMKACPWPQIPAQPHSPLTSSIHTVLTVQPPSSRFSTVKQKLFATDVSSETIPDTLQQIPWPNVPVPTVQGNFQNLHQRGWDFYSQEMFSSSTMDEQQSFGPIQGIPCPLDRIETINGVPVFDWEAYKIDRASEASITSPPTYVTTNRNNDFFGSIQGILHSPEAIETITGFPVFDWKAYLKSNPSAGHASNLAIPLNATYIDHIVEAFDAGSSPTYDDHLTTTKSTTTHKAFFDWATLSTAPPNISYHVFPLPTATYVDQHLEGIDKTTISAYNNQSKASSDRVTSTTASRFDSLEAIPSSTILDNYLGASCDRATLLTAPPKIDNLVASPPNTNCSYVNHMEASYDRATSAPPSNLDYLVVLPVHTTCVNQLEASCDKATLLTGPSNNGHFGQLPTATYNDYLTAISKLSSSSMCSPHVDHLVTGFEKMTECTWFNYPVIYSLNSPEEWKFPLSNSSVVAPTSQPKASVNGLQHPGYVALFNIWELLNSVLPTVPPGEEPAIPGLPWHLIPGDIIPRPNMALQLPSS